jgi:hypothetical protein
VIDRQQSNGNDDEKADYFFHLFNTFKRDHIQMLRVFFPALLFEHMLRVR